MSTITKSPAPVKVCRKPARTCKMANWNAHRRSGFLTITVGEKTDCYSVHGIDAAWGDAYRVEKYVTSETGEITKEEPYDVMLHGNESHCQCLGFLRHNHCRHIESLTALKNAGRLPS